MFISKKLSHHSWSNLDTVVREKPRMVADTEIRRAWHRQSYHTLTFNQTVTESLDAFALYKKPLPLDSLSVGETLTHKLATESIANIHILFLFSHSK
jgi:hypothetical protein